VEIGDIELRRVSYFDIPLDASAVGLTEADVRQVPWGAPAWSTDDAQVIVGQAIWVAESQGRVIVLDPCGAADDFLRTGEAAELHQARVREVLRDAGVRVERVDVVVLSHLDGIGMAAAVTGDGGWEPMFPNARIVMTQAELDWLSNARDVSGLDALRALVAQGVVDAVAARHDITDEVQIEQTGGHTPGHAIVWFRSDGDEAVSLGHLAVSPLHVAVGRGPGLHQEPSHAQRRLQELVTYAAEHGTAVLGPLWPAPGVARVDTDRALVPVPAA
jgi:glyoxylase-like metal-dependent hydrolase (beta-lactamase superfamily II)